MFDPTKLATFELTVGSHDDPMDGVCLMEAVAWLAGEPHSDVPQCACPVVGHIARGLNDRATYNIQRQDLVPYLPRIVGSYDGSSTANRLNAWIVNLFVAGHSMRETDAMKSLVRMVHGGSLAFVAQVLNEQHKRARPPSLFGNPGELFITRTVNQMRFLILWSVIDAAHDSIMALLPWHRRLALLRLVLEAGPQGTHDYDFTPRIDAFVERKKEIALCLS